MNNIIKKGISRFVVVLILSLFIEILVFNYQHFLSSDVNHRIIGFDECIYPEEYFEFVDDDGNEIVAMWSESGTGCDLYIPIDSNTNNIAINAYGKGAKVLLENNMGEGVRELDSASLELDIYGYSSNADALYNIYSGVICTNNGKVIYNIPNYRKYDGICLHFDTIEDYYVVVEGLEVNLIPPISFSFVRFAILLLICSLLVFKKEVKGILAEKNTRSFSLGISIIIGLLFAGMTFANPITKTDDVPIDSYNVLARAILDGHISVFDEYSHSLDALEHVYNYEERLESGLFYITDYAYFDGNYYVYFGVVPCLVLYLPYMLFTGKNLVNATAMAVIIFALSVGIGILLFELAERYFENRTKSSYIFSYLLVVFIAQLPGMISFPLVYQVAQCSGVACIVWGLVFYARAGSDKCVWGERRYIFLGSLLMALAVGCRPQLGILSLLAFPLLKSKMLTKKVSTVKLWLSFGAPFIIVAIPLMLYNYFRFGSVLDFGAGYNLTDDNIVSVTISFDKIKAGFKYMFIDAPRFSARFPFIDFYYPEYNIDRLVKGTTGGLFTLNILAVMAFVPASSSKDEKKIELRIMQYLFLSLSLFIGVLDVTGNGCIERYKFDFGVWIGVATVIVCLGILEKYKARWIRYALVAGLMLTFFTSTSMYFYSDALRLIDYDKELFQAISRTVLFWS